MSLNLFAPLSEQKKDVLVEFKAGKMNFDPNTKLVTPDKRKGLVQLRQKPDDELMHFIWRERLTGQEEHDLIVFPDAAIFRKVKEANTRVYVLEFKNSEKKLFFWLQEVKTDKDEQNCADINKFMNNPPQPGAGNAAGLGGLGGIEGMDQSQLLQLLANVQGAGGGAGGLGNLLRGVQQRQAARANAGASPASTLATPSTPSVRAPAASANSAPNAGAVSRSVLQNILTNVAQRNAVQQQNPSPSLSDVIDSEHIVNSGLFDNEEVVQKLAEYLPEGTPVTAENMKENVNSPQFKQAISMFNEALRSGELATIMSSFGLEAKDIGPNATIEDFLKAIQKQAQTEKESSDKDMDTEKS